MAINTLHEFALRSCVAANLAMCSCLLCLSLHAMSRVACVLVEWFMELGYKRARWARAGPVLIRDAPAWLWKAVVAGSRLDSWHHSCSFMSLEERHRPLLVHKCVHMVTSCRATCWAIAELFLLSLVAKPCVLLVVRLGSELCPLQALLLLQRAFCWPIAFLLPFWLTSIILQVTIKAVLWHICRNCLMHHCYLSDCLAWWYCLGWSLCAGTKNPLLRPAGSCGTCIAAAMVLQGCERSLRKEATWSFAITPPASRHHLIDSGPLLCIHAHTWSPLGGLTWPVLVNCVSLPCSKKCGGAISASSPRTQPSKSGFHLTLLVQQLRIHINLEEYSPFLSLVHEQICALSTVVEN